LKDGASAPSISRAATTTAWAEVDELPTAELPQAGSDGGGALAPLRVLSLNAPESIPMPAT
jgi:hypothetical protein